MNLVDAHCHLHMLAESDILQLSRYLQKHNLDLHVIDCGLDESSKAQQQKLMGKTRLTAALSQGLHPYSIAARANKKNISKSLDVFKKEPLKSHPFLGEVGLDFREKYLSRFCEKSQTSLLGDILSISEQKVVSLHIVKAYHRICSIIKKHPHTYLIHDFHGSSSLLEDLLKSDCYFSLGSYFSKNPSEESIKALKKIPAERILIETDFDSPLDFCPETYIKTLLKTYASVANFRKTSENRLITQVYQNYSQISSQN